MEDDHRAIRDLLKRERKRLGEDVSGSRERSKVKKVGEETQPNASSVKSNVRM